ncbi:response regulator [Rhodospirillaceae bacterium SYSU D60014]|jgi:two-component system, OmpR family, phosphate regulon response regulator OmpR|uniref:response regulator n=1 Tax=Virgifigura deserti TaxID=2268457 RepID=UPI000E675C24
MTEEMPHILVVDDDRRLRELLRKYLSEQGFRVTVAGDAADARARLAGIAFDLIVLDIMMPGETGLELTAALRADSKVPILLLTAMAEAEDRITGLEQGADDYLPKPFEPRELVLRIRTILRRVPQETVPKVQEIRFGEHSFDLDRQLLRRGAEEVRLTTAEADLLSALARSPGVPLSREELSRQAGIAAGNSRTVDVQMARLRRKIEPHSRFPRYLQTVRGRGYMLRQD